MKVFIFITLCLISGQVLCVKVFGCTGGSLMFKCMYKTDSKTDDQHKLKSFCRDKSCKMGISSDDQHKVKSFCRDMSCKMGISSDVQSQWVYSGRFALYDDENSRFFTVFIRNLSREDKGKYTCGNNQTWSHDVTIVVNNISESSCGKSVIQDGYLGQKTITFRCEYDEKFKTYTKVFYRLKDDPVHVLNSSRLSQSSEEKFILSDNHKDHFNVTIRDISAADGGVYFCGVERNRSDHRPSETSVTHITFSTEIQLNLYGKITSVQVQAYSSKSVFITCQFPQEFKGNKKFIQKYPSEKMFIDGQNQWVHDGKLHMFDGQNQWVHDDGKLHMFDDSSEGRLQVFISDLTADDDNATYRCGVNIADKHLFTEIKLSVNQVDHFPASSKASAIIGESVKLTCYLPEKHDETFTHFCKENKEKICESISSSEKKRFEFSASTAGVFTVSISNVSVRDAGVYWCGAETRHTHLTSVCLTNGHQLTPTHTDTERKASQDKGKSDSFVIVAVSVGLILLAVCLVLMLLKIKYSCKHGIVSSSDRRQTGDHEMVQDSDPTSTHLYSTVQLSTIPSDLQNPLYSTAQLPTIPSDLQNPLYSTAQLPKIPSEGLLYASVSFQNEESLSDAKVAFRKNEIQSDYASVKHNNTPNYDYH